MIKDILRKENFPIDGEAYVVGEVSTKAGKKYFFAWGADFPFSEDVPFEDVPDGESGIEWFQTEEEARRAMKNAIEAWEVG